MAMSSKDWFAIVGVVVIVVGLVVVGGLTMAWFDSGDAGAWAERTRTRAVEETVEPC